MASVPDQRRKADRVAARGIEQHDPLGALAEHRQVAKLGLAVPGSRDGVREQRLALRRAALQARERAAERARLAPSLVVPLAPVAWALAEIDAARSLHDRVHAFLGIRRRLGAYDSRAVQRQVAQRG